MGIARAPAKVPEAILPPPSAVFDEISQHYRLILKNPLPTTFDTLVAFGISHPARNAARSDDDLVANAQ